MEADLFWEKGAAATSHNVYFGTTNPPPFIRNQTAQTYDPDVLQPNTTYYWKIDEVNGSAIWPGELWSFTTGPIGVENLEFPADMFVNVRDHGVYGDGIHDDTEALQNVIGSHERIYLPSGTYLVSDTITWPRQKLIQGQNQQGTIIKLKNSCSGYQSGGKPVLYPIG